MDPKRDKFSDQERQILEEMKDLPLEVRLKMMRSNMGLLQNKQQKETHSKNYQETRTSTRRGGPKEYSAKERVYKNKVNEH